MFPLRVLNVYEYRHCLQCPHEEQCPKLRLEKHVPCNFVVTYSTAIGKKVIYLITDPIPFQLYTSYYFDNNAYIIYFIQLIMSLNNLHNFEKYV